MRERDHEIDTKRLTLMENEKEKEKERKERKGESERVRMSVIVCERVSFNSINEKPVYTHHLLDHGYTLPLPAQ